MASVGGNSIDPDPPGMTCAVAIFAHNEARRIGKCLASLPLDRPGTQFHLLVNGSTDGTATVAAQWAARHANVTAHDWAEGGKSRSWNRFVFDVLSTVPDVLVFMDGDAEIAAGSIDALVAALNAAHRINAAAGLPLNGRRHRAYQRQLRADGGLFGDLYALDGGFVQRLRDQNIRLPDDLIGDDGLVAALAMTNLGKDADWQRDCMTVAEGAGFYCEPTDMLSPITWHVQYRRMINYAERHFQNRIVSDIMGKTGAIGLPVALAPHYAAWLPVFRPRPGLINQWFDRLALKRMKQKAISAA